MDIEDYIEKNYPSGTLSRVVRVLGNYPFITGQRHGNKENIIQEKVTLIFADGLEKILQNSGSVYDYGLLSRTRYETDLSVQQIKTIVGEKREEPVTFRYQLDHYESGKEFGPVEIPYHLIKKLIRQVKNKMVKK